MFKRLYHRFMSRSAPVQSNEYVVLPMLTLKQTLSPATFDQLCAAIEQARQECPMFARQHWMVMEIPRDTSTALIELANAPASLTRH